MSDLPDDEARKADLHARFGFEAVEDFRALKALILEKFPGRTLGVDLSIEELGDSIRETGLVPEIFPAAH